VPSSSDVPPVRQAVARTPFSHWPRTLKSMMSRQIDLSPRGTTSASRYPLATAYPPTLTVQTRWGSDGLRAELISLRNQVGWKSALSAIRR
jgi:hypothetical protein